MTLYLLFMLALVSGIIAFVSLQSDKFSIARSIIIDRPPQDVYPEINDFHAWRSWSPLAKLEDGATEAFDGPPLGAGAIYEWSDDRRLGTGKMKIVESSQNERISIKRHIKKPIDAIENININLTEIGAGTEVVWQVSRRLDFMGKSSNILKGLEKRTGFDSEQGLKNLKSQLERAKA